MEKKTKEELLKRFLIVCTIIGCLLFAFGIIYPIPDREIPWNYKEYVGGDAYNLIIEASIRGGEIAGATIMKTICIIVGFLLMFICSFIISYRKAENLIKVGE